MNSPLLAGARFILDTFAAAGYEAYMVGGCVRDDLMNRPIRDIDIATSALPEETIRLFPKVVPTGLQHGTVTVLIGDDGYEVTTYRREAAYEDFRRPSGVEFVTSLAEDLRRRDFTMNAIAMDRDGRLQDPFDGRADIAAGCIRCVGDAAERFGEDALRMLRAVRFAGTLGFTVEPATWTALRERRELLRHVAMERVRAELERLTDGPDPLGGWRLLLASGLLAQTKRPLPLPAVRWSAQDAPAAWQGLAALGDADARWTLLLRAMRIPPDQAQAALGALVFSGEAQRAVVGPLKLDTELRARLADGKDAAVAFKEAALVAGKPAAERWLQVTAAAAPYETEETTALREAANRGKGWLAEMSAYSIKDLAIDGAALMRHLAIKPGPSIGRLLGRLLQDVAIRGAANEQGELLRCAANYAEEASSAVQSEEPE